MGGPQGSADAEKILSLNPDIVFSLYTSDKAAMDDLQQKIGKPVVVLSYGKTEAFDVNVKKSIALLGDILNRKEPRKRTFIVHFRHGNLSFEHRRRY